ncbi:hypothetical protein CAPTEDRAFT_110225 [Capitella teleta]|uniref:STAT transcription factor protein interaction domain-containing protein n=1 Tax=Capitella teleta TaxID=283909 RepID=R7TVH4_CAPTE|nr:hypothetical protein CAPTEDRAFT_110225 [Capitella teleta]|eukprot:ELT97587.1 hypothetical protein CAPTEDRAFT_110225 [Capitella teleta]
MALWGKVQKLTGDQIRTVQAAYGIHFPIEVRHYFAHWIEQQPWYTLIHIHGVRDCVLLFAGWN